MNVRRTPERVLKAHAPDQSPKLNDKAERRTAIAIREPDATAHLALQDCQLTLSAAFSAASWPCGLDGNTSSLTRKMSSAIIVASRYAIPSLDQTDEVFSTHRSLNSRTRQWKNPLRDKAHPGRKRRNAASG